MALLKLNRLKTKAIRFFTRSYVNSKKPLQTKDLARNKNIRVLISRPNHRLGNQLLITPLIQEVKKEFPASKIDLVVNGNLSSVLFSEDSHIGKIFNLPKKPFNNIFKYLAKSISLIFTNYDIAIAACDHSNSSKIFVKLSRAKLKIYNSASEALQKPEHIAKRPVFNFKKFLNSSEDLSGYEYSKLSIKLTNEEIEKGKLLIKKLFNNNKKTLCIFTFATGAKCHSEAWWAQFYNALKDEFSDVNILEILPIENVSQINFQSTHFYSKDLREIASLIEGSDVFIGADSGMMHLAASTNTRTIGLFNTTNPKVYTPYGNTNESVDTNVVGVDEIIGIIKKQKT